MEKFYLKITIYNTFKITNDKTQTYKLTIFSIKSYKTDPVNPMVHIHSQSISTRSTTGFHRSSRNNPSKSPPNNKYRYTFFIFKIPFHLLFSLTITGPPESPTQPDLFVFPPKQNQLFAFFRSWIALHLF